MEKTCKMSQDVVPMIPAIHNDGSTSSSHPAAAASRSSAAFLPEMRRDNLVVRMVRTLYPTHLIIQVLSQLRQRQQNASEDESPQSERSHRPVYGTYEYAVEQRGRLHHIKDSYNQLSDVMSLVINDLFDVLNEDEEGEIQAGEDSQSE